MSGQSGLDIVTRLYDLADLPHLDRLVFTVMGQADAMPLQLHIMLQRFSFTEVQAVRAATRELRLLHDRASVILHNWDYPAPFDLSVPLLNWGLEVAQGRYLMCLDVYDQLRPNACTTLLRRLHATEAALALGGAALWPAWWSSDVILPASAQCDGSTPTRVFIADRSRLAIKDCVFRSGEPHSEIEEFIERIGTRYGLDTISQDDILAIRIRPI